ncbi:MAG: nucleoside recognition domain-containing protein [Alkalispirochaeta sp.]
MGERNIQPQPEGLPRHLRESTRKSIETILWLAKIMVPASALVFALRFTGVLRLIAGVLAPVTQFLELPGAAALALLTSVAANLYGVIAMLPTLELTLRETTIIAVVTLVAHSFFVELAITASTGTPVLRMFGVRAFGGVILGKILAMILPRGGRWDLPATGISGMIDSDGAGSAGAPVVPASSPPPLHWQSLPDQLFEWLLDTVSLLATVAVVVTVLLFVTRYLRYVGITDRIAALFRPVMAPFGLDRESSTPWVVANTLGLTYGAAVLKEEADTGRLTPEEGDLLNHHLGISHSLIEDTLLFVALGVPWYWIALPRLVFAVVVVWERRLERVLGWTKVGSKSSAAVSGER